MNSNISYPEFKTWKWGSFSEPNRIADIEEFVLLNSSRGMEFHIGSDSKMYGNHTNFVTALIAHEKSKGGQIIIHQDKTVKSPSLRQRLIMEAMRTMEVAWYLDSIIDDNVKIRLHIDVNDELKFKSGQYKEELVGMIMGQGYSSYESDAIDNCDKIVFWKPHSWAASTVADRRT